MVRLRRGTYQYPWFLHLHDIDMVGVPGEAYPGSSDIQTWPLYVWIDFHRSYGSVFIGWVQLLVAELLPSMVIWWDFSSFHYFSNLTKGLLCLEVFHGDLRFKGRDIYLKGLCCVVRYLHGRDLKLEGWKIFQRSCVKYGFIWWKRCVGFNAVVRNHAGH